jgi:preprotein translocase subunit SecY
MLIYNPTTAGWWFQSLWKMMEFVNWDDDIPHIWKNKKCSKPPTSNTMMSYIAYLLSFIYYITYNKWLYIHIYIYVCVLINMIYT